MKYFDFLFPPSEDECRITSLPIDTFTKLSSGIQKKTDTNICTLLPYSNKQVRSAIHLLKFHNHSHARKLLSEVLTQYLETLILSEYIIIPIPLSSKRLRKRGYNQVSEVIRESLKDLTKGALTENILIRTRNTAPQTTLSREKRLLNLTNAFAVRNISSNKTKLHNRHILLIDDVTTTGATLKEAEATLLSLSPASITCIALAH